MGLLLVGYIPMASWLATRCNSGLKHISGNLKLSTLQDNAGLVQPFSDKNNLITIFTELRKYQ